MNNIDKQPNPNLKTVIVFKTGNIALLAIAKSLLDDAGILHFETEFAINNFGLGAVFGVYNPIFGPAEIRVGEHDADDAKELLKDIAESQPEE